METFTLHHVSFTYPKQERPALREVDLSVPQGEFLILCGPSGCGKTTLLRQLKSVLTPHGARTGTVLFQEQPLEEVDQRRQAQDIGFVFQDPDNQIVTDKVWHELAFGLESLGFDTPTIRRRVAEMASYFGIQDWFHMDINQLSGGQKQLLNLASVMVMQPSVLVLDEPTSQLDPIAASDFLATLERINRELGTTIILSEHRLEEALPLADRVVVMEDGEICFSGSPREAGFALKDWGHSMFLAMPTPMRVWAKTPRAGETCPLTVREGREWLAGIAREQPLRAIPPEPVYHHLDEPALEAEGLWFRYEKDTPDVIKRLSITLKKGEFIAFLGGNATGKTTALKLLSGLLKPSRGQVRLKGRAGVMPQDPRAVFLKSTLADDLLDTLRDSGLSEDDQTAKVCETVRLCALENLLDRHPHDLSGGERQRAALAKVLLLKPDVLFLDEPTKGLDAGFKARFAEILQALSRQGVSILMVSHDVEFCAQYAHRCALFFDGAIVNAAPPRDFFSGNSFYTTATNRMAREVMPCAVTAEDIITACGGEAPRPTEREESKDAPVRLPPKRETAPKKPLAPWRKALAWGFGAMAAVLLLHFLGVVDLTALLARAGITNRARRQLILYGIFAVSMMALGFVAGRSGTAARRPAKLKHNKLSKRTALASVLILLLVPLTLWLGESVLEGEKKYYAVALLVLAECMIPFFLVFEGRRPHARELVLLAALCGIAAAGRMVFFMLPEFKPVAALVVITGAALGAESGFLVGSLTMLASNILFSQGPWTPWQMFALGLIGFLAGLVFQSGFLRPTRLSLCLFGGMATILIYGGVMNFQSALTWNQELNQGILLSYYAAGFPMDCIHAAATWVFLWFGGEAMLEKLDRVKVKYGLIE